MDTEELVACWTSEEGDALGNAYWVALWTEQAALAIGGDTARRFPADTIPFAGLREDTPTALAALWPLMQPGEQLFVMSRKALPPSDLRTLSVTEGQMMALPRSAVPDRENREEPVIELLGSRNLEEIAALKAIAFPGFFGPRAATLGNFAGIRIDGRLVAMAGERLALPAWREISAVCTHPEHLGRGYAARLVRHQIEAQAQAGLRSFLGVDGSNYRAIALYERLGFIRVCRTFWNLLRRPE